MFTIYVCLIDFNNGPRFFYPDQLIHSRVFKWSKLIYYSLVAQIASHTFSKFVHTLPKLSTRREKTQLEMTTMMMMFSALELLVELMLQLFDRFSWLNALSFCQLPRTIGGYCRCCGIQKCENWINLLISHRFFLLHQTFVKTYIFSMECFIQSMLYVI